MTRNSSYARLARGGAAVSVLVLTGAVLWLFAMQGYTGSGIGTGLPFLAVAVSWAGFVALVRDLNGLAIAIAVALLFMSVWQMAIWIVILPVAACLALGGILAGGDKSGQASAVPE